MIGQARRGWVAVAATGAAIVLGGVGYGIAAGNTVPGAGGAGTVADAATDATDGAVGLQVWLAGDSGTTGTGTSGNGPCLRDISAAIGTLTSVNGGTLTIRNADGRTTTVTTSPSTYVAEIATGGLSDIHNGDRVLVRGSTGSDGTISAEQVHLLPDLPSRPAPVKPLPAQPGGRFAPNLGLAVGTVADRTATGFTVVGQDGSHVSVTTPSSTSVVDATRTTVGALRVGHQVEAAGTAGGNGAINAVQVSEIDVPVHLSAPKLPSGLPHPPARLRLPNGAKPPAACLPGGLLPG